MKTTSKSLNLRFILLTGTALLLLIVQAFGLFSNITTPFERLEYSMQDAFVRLRGGENPSDDIVIVAIDDQSFNWTGLQWPWPRSYFAEIVDQINKGGGKVIGIDVTLFEPDERHPENDTLLANALRNSPASASIVQINKVVGQGFEAESLSQPMSVYRDVLDGVELGGE